MFTDIDLVIVRVYVQFIYSNLDILFCLLLRVYFFIAVLGSQKN